MVHVPVCHGLPTLLVVGASVVKDLGETLEEAVGAGTHFQDDLVELYHLVLQLPKLELAGSKVLPPCSPSELIEGALPALFFGNAFIR